MPVEADPDVHADAAADAAVLCRLVVLQQALHMARTAHAPSASPRPLCSLVSRLDCTAGKAPVLGTAPSQPLLVLCGRLEVVSRPRPPMPTPTPAPATPSAPADGSSDPSWCIVFRDSTGSLPCQMLDWRHRPLLGHDVCLWSWRLICPASAPTTASPSLLDGCIEILGIVRRDDCPTWFAALNEFVFARPLADLRLLPIIYPRARHRPSPSSAILGSDADQSRLPKAPPAKAGHVVIRGVLLAVSPISLAGSIGHCFLRVACTHTAATNNALAYSADAKLVAVLMLRDSHRPLVERVLSLNVGHEYMFANFKPRKLSLKDTDASFYFLAQDPAASLILPIDSAAPALPVPNSLDSNDEADDDRLTQTQASQSSAISDLVAAAASQPTQLWQNKHSSSHPVHAIFGGLCAEHVMTWSQAVISYCGQITEVLDHDLCILKLDNEYILSVSLGSLSVRSECLRPGATVQLSDVHLVFGPPPTPVCLVMCAATTLDLVAFSSRPVGPHTLAASSSCTSVADMRRRIARSMCFSDLAQFLGLEGMMYGILGTQLQAVETAAMESAAARTAQSILAHFGHTPHAPSDAHVFLDHDVACKPLALGTRLPTILSPQDIQTHFNEAVDALVAASSRERGLIVHREIRALDFGAQSLACLGRLCADADSGRLFLVDGTARVCVHVLMPENDAAIVGDGPTPGVWDGLAMLDHVVLLSGAVLVCEAVMPLAGSSADNADASGSASRTAYCYIQVAASNGLNVGHLESHTPTASTGPSAALPSNSASATSPSQEPVTVSLVLMPRAKRSPVLAFQSLPQARLELETIVQGMVLVPGSLSTHAKPHLLSDVFLRFRGASAHLPELLVLGSTYAIQVSASGYTALSTQGAVDWQPHWTMKLDTSPQSYELLAKGVEQQNRTDEQQPVADTVSMAGMWRDSLMTITCRILSKRLRLDHSLAGVLAAPSEPQQRDAARKTPVGSAAGVACLPSPADLARRWMVGVGRADAVVVIKVCDQNTGDTMDVLVDTRTRPYPLGLTPGRVVRLENVAVKMVKGGRDVQLTMLPVTRVVVVDGAAAKDATTRTGSIAAAGGLPSSTFGGRHANGSPQRTLVRLCTMVSRRLAPQAVYIDAHVTAVPRVAVSLVCSACNRTSKGSAVSCPSGCPDPSFVMQTEAIVSIQDGTAEATVTLTTFDLVASLLCLDVGERKQLQSLAESYGEVAYAAIGFGDSSGSAFDSGDGPASDVGRLKGQMWLEKMCKNPRWMRRVRILADIRPQFVSNAAKKLMAAAWAASATEAEGSGGTGGASDACLDRSITCVADAFMVRQRTLKLGGSKPPIETVCHWRIKLVATGFVELDARVMTRDLLARLEAAEPAAVVKAAADE